MDLHVEGISLQFGGLTVLENISMHVPEGSVCALIGPNGAGKTSLLNCISGFYRPKHGRVRLGDKELTGLRPDQITLLGVTRMFQNVELFPHLNVLDNIRIGRHIHVRYSPLEAALEWGRKRREEIGHMRRAEEIIDFLDLQAVRHRPVASLPYGIQKKVELGRALATEGNFLLLDEPFGGLSLEEKQDMARYVLETRQKFRCTVLLIDHDVQAVADIADHISVLHYGQKIAEGEPEAVLTDPAVIEAYLGTRGGHGSKAEVKHG